ncbi:MAG: helix-turn-helix domain-containing protein [Chloroflexi bacterium]|nr:MAG: helix-turn-helix domain-containing protein [Chloroflexota bacterium]
MEIKPVRNEADYQAALKEIEKLMESQPGTPEGDRMDVLVTLVEAYEDRHFAIPEPDDPVQVLEYYMESRGLSRTDLIEYLGSKERVSEVLNRKRGLSLEMIRRLHNGLGIPADLIIGKHARSYTHNNPARTKPQVRVHEVRPKGVNLGQ